MIRKTRQGLWPGRGHRGSLLTSVATDNLARELLQEACDKIGHRPRARVTVEVTRDLFRAYPHALMLSCKKLSKEYGLKLESQHGNELTFAKVLPDL